jgi:hypothetical protein
MSRTRRRKIWGEPGSERDGKSSKLVPMPADEFTVEVRRRDRREREADADRQATGAADPDDVPTKPRPRRLWQFWRRW